MKVLMILSNPFMVDPRVHKEAKTLVDAGHEVAVIVWDRRHDYASRDVVDGIKLIRLHNDFLMMALPNNLFRNPLWWKKSYRTGIKLYKDGFDFDVVHCHDLDTLKTGVRLKKKLGCKLVYDAHEIFGYMIEGNIPQFVVNFVFRMEKKLVKNVDHMITVSEPLKKYFKKITNVPITIVMNCKSLISKKYQHPPKNNIFTVCYIGSFVKSRLFPYLIDIIGGIENVKFIVGGMKSGLYEEVKNRCERYDNVEFLGQILFKNVISTTLGSNIIICIFDPDIIGHQIGLPNKVFEAMATGRPIIVTKDMYYSTNFVEKEKCGLSVENNSASIRKAIIKLRDDPKLCEKLGKNGLATALKKYNWEKQKDKLLKVYRGLK